MGFKSLLDFGRRLRRFASRLDMAGSPRSVSLAARTPSRPRSAGWVSRRRQGRRRGRKLRGGFVRAKPFLLPRDIGGHFSAKTLTSGKTVDTASSSTGRWTGTSDIRATRRDRLPRPRVRLPRRSRLRPSPRPSHLYHMITCSNTATWIQAMLPTRPTRARNSARTATLRRTHPPLGKRRRCTLPSQQHHHHSRNQLIANSAYRSGTGLE